MRGWPPGETATCRSARETTARRAYWKLQHGRSAAPLLGLRGDFAVAERFLIAARHIDVDLQYEEVAMAFRVRKRRGKRHGKAGGGVTLNAFDLGHGQAGREETADTAGNEFVARFDVGTRRQIAHFQYSVGATTERDEPQTVAQNLHRHRELVIGDERGLGRERRDAYDLTDHPAFIDHGHARADAAGAALVENEMMIERTGGLEEHFDGHRRLRDRVGN